MGARYMVALEPVEIRDAIAGDMHGARPTQRAVCCSAAGGPERARRPRRSHDAAPGHTHSKRLLERVPSRFTDAHAGRFDRGRNGGRAFGFCNDRIDAIAVAPAPGIVNRGGCRFERSRANAE
jgi:hypothetical protein